MVHHMPRKRSHPPVFKTDTVIEPSGAVIVGVAEQSEGFTGGGGFPPGIPYESFPYAMAAIGR